MWYGTVPVIVVIVLNLTDIFYCTLFNRWLWQILHLLGDFLLFPLFLNCMYRMFIHICKHFIWVRTQKYYDFKIDFLKSILQRYNQRKWSSTLWITNGAYNQRLLKSTSLFTAWFNHQIPMRPIQVLRSRTPAGDRCAHFFFCNHNIYGSGLKWKNRWRWLYDALIICCVARIVAEPWNHMQWGNLSTRLFRLYRYLPTCRLSCRIWL
jgi:hypothetical protein